MTLPSEVRNTLRYGESMAAEVPAKRDGGRAWVFVQPRSPNETPEFPLTINGDCSSLRFYARRFELSEWHLNARWYLGIDLAVQQRPIHDAEIEVRDEDELARQLHAWCCDPAELRLPELVDYPIVPPLKKRSNARETDKLGAPYAGQRFQTEGEWLDFVDTLITQLSEVTNCTFEIGSYWGSTATHEDSRASFGVCVRAKQPLPGIESDYWEAQILVDRDEGGTVADVYGFPFLGGSAMTPHGKLDPSCEMQTYWRFQYLDDTWVCRGWEPDAYYEWSYVNKPGDVYSQSLQVVPAHTEFAAGDPILVEIQLGQLSIGPPFSSADPDAAVAPILSCGCKSRSGTDQSRSLEQSSTAIQFDARPDM